MSQLIPSITPLRVFEGHEDGVVAVAVFPDRRRLITSSMDMTLRWWDLKTGVALKKMEGHRCKVWSLTVSRDGQLIASGDEGGELIVWHGESGKCLTQPIKVHSHSISSLNFSPDGTAFDSTTKLWNIKTWQLLGNPIYTSDNVFCVRYSPSGELLAIATFRNIEIFNPATREHVATFKGHSSYNMSLAWTPDGTRLLSGGNNSDPTIRQWDALTWEQVGDPWSGHTHYIIDIAINPTGTLVASASDYYVRLWRLSDQQTIAIFQHSSSALCVTFSMDGKHVFSGGLDRMISEWTVPEDAFPEEALNKPASKAQISDSKILAINTTARNACIAGDLSTAENLFTQEINTNANSYTSYAGRSFVRARQHNWDDALDDANKSVSIQPSLTGYISKGVARFGKGEARDLFDLAFMFTNEDSDIIHFLLLIKAIAMFNADQHEEAIMGVQELATTCPSNDTLACCVVEAYLFVQLGISAMDDARHNEAVVHFTTAVNCITFSSTSAIHTIYEDLVVLFGWDLKSLWKNAHQQLCDALRCAGRLEDALESYRRMMDMSDEHTMASCLDWSNAFKQEFSALYVANGDAALAANDYDRAIDSYSLAIELYSTDTIFASRSRAKLSKSLWEDAFHDAQKVIELNPSSHVGYELKHAAHRGAQHYDKAIEAFETMLTKLDNAPEAQIRKLRQQYISPSEAEDAIRRAVWTELENSPIRLLNTSTGLLCDRAAQINAFKTSTEYKELLLFTTKYSDLRTGHIEEVIALYFRCVLLSHRWEETEALLHDIQDKVVYELDDLGGIVKLQSFCKIARDAGYCWAWMDTCCIDKNSNTELQESINSMFIWYRHSALTIVYLCDVPPSSHSGALAGSSWNERGWTFQEFVASQTVIFYQKDWSLYLNNRSSNHKESPEIMKELVDATGIDARALVNFRPGMSGAREKLQWASKRVTTVQEDIAYSLFGIFGITLPVIYGEKKQNALGRLLQEIVARSGDITALDWVGQSSEFNSCLPADITSYAAPPCALPSLSEDEIQTAVSSLRNTVPVEFASKLYTRLENMSAPRFAHCRLQMHCIVFRVTEVKRRRGPGEGIHSTYGVKADGLQDLLITTAETLVQFSRARPTRQTFLLVRPWDRRLLELPDFSEQLDFADDAESVGDWPEPGSPLNDSDEFPGGSPVEEELVHSESHSRALRLIVRLGQPFSAFLLAQQRVAEYRRIASDHDIIAEVKDVASVHNMMDIRTLDIL